MDERNRGIQEEILWCMLFADDRVLVDETRERVHTKLERCKDNLEVKGFKLSRSKKRNTYTMVLVRAAVVFPTK